MKEEYNFNVTVPLGDVARLGEVLDRAKKLYPQIRISRKTDRADYARYYISFPLTSARQDLKFQDMLKEVQQSSWDIYGPTYGRWGFS